MTLQAGHRKNRASTHPGHGDRALRGRTYAIPFDVVWQAAVRLTSGGLSRWSLLDADDGPGTLQVEARALLWGRPTEFMIRISLDRNAQTRVDAVGYTPGSRWDLGASRRRTIRFFGALDREVGAGAGAILAGAPAAAVPS